MLGLGFAYAACKTVIITFLAHATSLHLLLMAAIVGGETYLDSLVAFVPDTLRGTGQALAFGLALRQSMLHPAFCTALWWLPHGAWLAATVLSIVFMHSRSPAAAAAVVACALCAATVSCVPPSAWSLWQGVVLVALTQALGAVAGQRALDVSFVGMLLAAPVGFGCVFAGVAVVGFFREQWGAWSTRPKNAKRPSVGDDLQRKLEAMESSLPTVSVHKAPGSRIFG